MSDQDLSLAVVDAFESAIDEKISKAVDTGTSQHLAQVTRIDKDGTAWVHIYGGAEETPVENALSTLKVGDVISATINNNSVTVVGNVTTPAATTGYVGDVSAKLSQEQVRAVANIMNNLLQVEQVVAKKATIDELVVVDAMVQTLAAQLANIDTLVAGKIDARVAELEYAKIDFANVESAYVDEIKIRDLLAQSGWFEKLSTPDGSFTGILKAVKIVGDLIQANTIAADRIILQGTDPETGLNNGLWYALNASNGGTEYLDLTQEQYAEALDGSHIVAKSVTADQIDVNSLLANEAFVRDMRTILLTAVQMQVGDARSSHIEFEGDRMSFKTGDGTEVAYIAVNDKQDGTKESVFYMNKGVVLDALDFGYWKWFERPNHNMALKWVGGDD